MSRIKRMLRFIVCFFFPERCIFCNEVIEPFRLCCNACRERISTVKPPICTFCGRHKKDCTCKKKRFAYDKLVAPFYYEEAVREGILRLKHRDDPLAIEFFASQMAAVLRRECSQETFDAICYVPMTKRDQRRREYNQSKLLAVALAKTMNVPLRNALVKLYPTKPQKGLRQAQRAGNVLGVFDLDEPLPGQSVLLIDDVVTTGSTLNECAKMLKLAGAHTVTVAAIAVSAPEKKEGSAT